MTSSNLTAEQVLNNVFDTEKQALRVTGYPAVKHAEAQEGAPVVITSAVYDTAAEFAFDLEGAAYQFTWSCEMAAGTAGIVNAAGLRLRMTGESVDGDLAEVVNPHAGGNYQMCSGCGVLNVGGMPGEYAFKFECKTVAEGGPLPLNAEISVRRIRINLMRVNAES